MRFGLAGTGYWARTAHAPALAAADGVEFAAVWGRNPEAAADLAAGYGAAGYGDFGAFLAAVDAVAFAIPPDVQAPLAAQAARAGKHLLLEKPIALTGEAADALVSAVEQAGVASVVFFTQRFRPDVRDWLAELGGTGGWAGGVSAWLGSSLRERSPFNTPWRNLRGGLWDIGPHMVSLLWAALGPVTAVTADAGRADITHLVLHHQGGATSTTTVTLTASAAAEGFEMWVWGEHGRSAAPAGDTDEVAAMRTALAELGASADASGAPGRGHPCDVRFGRDVGRVLAEAQRQIDARHASARDASTREASSS
jgi:predicted dehydrogenase